MVRNQKTIYQTIAALAFGVVFTITVSSQQAIAQSAGQFNSSVVAKSENKFADPSLKSMTERLPTPTPTPTPNPAPSSSWSGFYAGGYGGGNFAGATADTSTTFSPSGYFAASSVLAVNAVGRQKVDTNGFAVGGQGGFNLQSGNFVVGVEGDLGWMGGKSTATNTAPYPDFAPSTFTLEQSVEIKWLATVRPRVGYLRGNTLFYLTGGIALADLKYQMNFTDNFAGAAVATGSINKTKFGWTGGGGAEHKFAGRWSVKGEYLYTDLGRSSGTSNDLKGLTPPIPFPATVFEHSFYWKAHLLRFGVNYHF